MSIFEKTAQIQLKRQKVEDFRLKTNRIINMRGQGLDRTKEMLIKMIPN